MNNSTKHYKKQYRKWRCAITTGQKKISSKFLEETIYKEKRKVLNTITISGRIVNDLELKTTPSGLEILSFTVACERDYKDKNGEKQTDFIDVVAYKHTAVFVEKYFGKGRMAIVNGRLATRNWEDKNGNKRKAVEIIADNVYFADSKTEQKQTEPKKEVEFAEMSKDEDFPF